MSTKIREWHKQDINRIVEIENEVHVEPWDAPAFLMCMRQDYQGYVLIEKEKKQETIIGFVIISFFSNECHILNLAVALDHQRKGLGKLLLVHTLEEAQKKYHATIAYLEVRRSNTRAIQLYSSFNFKNMGERKNYYAGPYQPEDALIFAKILND